MLSSPSGFVTKILQALLTSTTVATQGHRIASTLI